MVFVNIITAGDNSGVRSLQSEFNHHSFLETVDATLGLFLGETTSVA